ncbi:MAG: hypothetical protein LBH59_05325 [Planctomycetaceae bacterium]|nr:hypothetical protein [Planctomycetaceae bacterium]
MFMGEAYRPYRLRYNIARRINNLYQIALIKKSNLIAKIFKIVATKKPKHRKFTMT